MPLKLIIQYINLGLPIFCKGYYKKQFRFYFNYKFW